MIEYLTKLDKGYLEDVLQLTADDYVGDVQSHKEATLLYHVVQRGGPDDSSFTPRFTMSAWLLEECWWEVHIVVHTKLIPIAIVRVAEKMWQHMDKGDIVTTLVHGDRKYTRLCDFFGLQRFDFVYPDMNTSRHKIYKYARTVP